jgi:predicted nucleic acid-binding protein
VIVVDASAVIEALINPDDVPQVEESFSHTVLAPHLIDLEVIQVLRRLVRADELTADRASNLVEQYAFMPIERMPHTPFFARIWQLRNNVTAYDAIYIALAEHYRAPLLTRDRRLSMIAGHHAKVIVI